MWLWGILLWLSLELAMGQGGPVIDYKLGTNTVVTTAYNGTLIDARANLTITDSDFVWQIPPYLLSEDFESGTMMTWTRNTVTGIATTNGIQTNIVYSGACAGSFSIEATNAARRTFVGRALADSGNPFSVSNISELYAGVRFYIPSSTYVGTNSGNVVEGLLGQYVTGNVAFERMGISMSGTTNVMTVWVNSTAKVLTNAFTLDAWHTLQLYRKQDATSSGAATYWLDDNQIYTTNGLTTATNYTLGCFAGIIDSIPSNLSPYKLTVLLDDFRLSTNMITWETNALKTWYPDARGRIGFNLATILTGQQTDDTFQVTLSNPLSSTTVTNITGPSGRMNIAVNLRGQPQSMLTLNTTWRSAGGTIKGSTNYTWAKNYVGDPFYSIDEKNNFTTNNVPYFPIQVFFLPTNSIPTWVSSNVINSVFADNFGATSLNSLSNYLNNVTPIAGLNWIPWIGNKPALGVSPSNSIPVMTSYISNLMNNASISGWVFIDEPELYQTVVTNQFAWWQAQKALNPQSASFINLEGTVMDRGSGFNIGIANTWAQPYVNTDSIGFDMYPLDNPASYNFNDMHNATVYTVQCNYNTIPVFGYVAPCDTKESSGGPGPTPGEIEMQNWILVNSGAKAIQYFPYNGSAGFGNVYGSNLVQMAHFKNTVQTYSPWILTGTPIPVSTYPSATNNGPCYVAAWNYTNSIKVSIVNSSSNASIENIFMNGLTTNSVVSLDGSGPIPCSNGFFTATIPFETNEIFSVTP